ncbi:PLDc N-terminal domain-containing protein [Microbacterium esteraromaticum]|uniref:PLDc N-terminal domain-containing protein n=1 Tax=Microbacterium esteraromaticum TaxID=57043 RepID=A0A939ISI2_9MICO|nr:PLDc N-terminal domain-containing protein [Microbacterium esteraromaticum]MBN7794801.1 PLDc N-terminal domain-containing protein [Microbacterium esteraromaticum]MBN8206885.1 PLDc N-terminal domain-containing protein [Microbacterium esteraromaticum]MBN8417040.1 PLDc N-terminal domain-containing protein [Microbacterium esteraromaticum]
MPILFSLITIGLMVFAVVDIIRRDDSDVRYLPRIVWLLLVILLPLLGSVLWFALGRVYPEGGIRLPRRRPKPSQQQAPAAPAMPIDTRTTEQQIADLDREIEEWRLREEIEKRKKEHGGSSTGPETQEG